ncbi:hypothetical protein GCM10010433_29950 [Streptomyces pulveraceus]|uniref:Lonely Cys domain-containing protein n=1 Tax=Streptomyces pulveraceus TaxID=68258 RepID=A0ABW1GL06_9ACTN
MSIKATPELNNLLFVLIGERLLQADEDLAYASRRPYHRLSGRLTDLSSEIEGSVVGISRSLPPQVGANYLQSMRLFIDNGGTNHLREFSDQLKTIGDGRTETSMNITESKWQIIAELIRLMIELLVIFVMSFFTAGTTASDAAVAKGRSRVVVLTALDTLLKRTHLMPSLSEAFEEAFMNFAVRLAMMAAGPDGRRPKGFDWKAIAQDGVFGAFAGLFHGVFSSGMGKFLKNFKGPNPTKNLTKDVTGKVPPPKFSVKNLVKTGVKDTKDFLVSGGSEAVAEIVAGGLMTGKWSTSWDTFLGSGISGKAESVLSSGAAKPGKWVQNNFKNIPTSSRNDGNGTGSDAGGGSDSGNTTDSGTGTSTGSTTATGPGAGTGSGTGTGTGTGGGSGSGKGSNPTNDTDAPDRTESTDQPGHTEKTGQNEETDQPGDDEHTGPTSKTPPSGSTNPSDSDGPPTKESVNTSSKNDQVHTAPGGDNHDTSRGDQQQNDDAAPSRDERTPQTQQTQQSQQDSEATPPQADTDTDTGADTDTETHTKTNGSNESGSPDNDTEPSTGLLTEDGSSDTEQQLPPTPESPATPQATPPTDMANHRQGATPPPQETALRRELSKQLTDNKGGVTIFIDGAADVDHQAAATLLMGSLDGLGYKGPITAIVPDDVRKKLESLLSDEQSARVTWESRTFDPDVPVTDRRASGEAGAQGLVLVAAGDRLDHGSDVATRFLNFMGADQAVVLGPSARDASRRYRYTRPDADSVTEVTDLETVEESDESHAPIDRRPTPPPVAVSSRPDPTYRPPTASRSTLPTDGDRTRTESREPTPAPESDLAPEVEPAPASTPATGPVRKPETEPEPKKKKEKEKNERTPEPKSEPEPEPKPESDNDAETETAQNDAPATNARPPVASSSGTPPRLVLRSARSADDPTTDSDDVVRRTITDSSSDSSFLASYNPSDWSQRGKRFSTVVTSPTYQDHHHSEPSLYRKPRQLPWHDQKVSFFAAHGTPTRVKLTKNDGTEIVISGRELGRYLEHSADLGPKDRPIVLYACATGAAPTHGGLSVAQHVANLTGRTVYAPTTTTGTAIDSAQQIRPVLFRDSAENPGQWVSYAPEPSGAELTALARAAGLHPAADTEGTPGPWATTRTLQLVRTLRGTFGPRIEQSPDHHDLLAALGSLDNERFGGDDTVWAPYRDGRMTPDLLRRITDGLSGNELPGLERYGDLFNRVRAASGENGAGPDADAHQDDARSPSRDLTQEAGESSQVQPSTSTTGVTNTTNTTSTTSTTNTTNIVNSTDATNTTSTTSTTSTTDAVETEAVVQLVAAQLDTQRPATVDTAMTPAPPAGAIQQFPGDLRLPTYITGDGENRDSAFTYGQSEVIQRGVENILAHIDSSTLPVPARNAARAENNPLAELEQALTGTPHVFHGDGWVSAPFKDTAGRIRQLRVSQRPQAPWSMLTNATGEPITLDPVKVDQIHRSQITSGKSQTVSSARQFGISVPLGPPSGPIMPFGRVGLTLGFTKTVDFNLQDQTLSQVESRHGDESHLYLGDVMYTVELTDPAPKSPTALNRIARRLGRPDTNRAAEQHAPLTFGVKDGLLLRLPDNLTVIPTAEHAPEVMALGEHSDYRMVHTEGVGSVSDIHAWAVGETGAVVGSTMHAEITRFMSSENFIRLADRMAHGPVTSQPLFKENGTPAGVLVVDKIVPGRATRISGTSAVEIRDAIQRVIKNDRSTSTAYSQDAQVTFGPSFSFAQYATGAAQPRVQAAAFFQAGNRSTRTTGFGGAGSRKTVGRAKKVRTELYLVRKTVHVRKSGQEHATPHDVWTVDRMTRAEARRLAGWDDGSTLRTRTAQNSQTSQTTHLTPGNSPAAGGSNEITTAASGSNAVTAPATTQPGEPTAPVYLPENHPTLLGMARVEAFLPGDDPSTPPSTPPNATDSAAVSSTNPPPTPPPANAFLTELTNNVIAAVAEKHPGIVAPLADFTNPTDKSKGWRGNNHFSAALLNTISLMDALSHHSMAGQLESFVSDGVRIRLVDTTGTKRKHRTILVRGALTGRRYEGTRNELILRSSTHANQRLDSSGTVSHTREFGIDVGVSARQNATDVFGQPLNSGVISPAGRYAWQKNRKTGSGATVAYEPLHATSGPSHVFSYQLDVSVTSGGFWRFRQPLRVLGVLGTGYFVGRGTEVDLIGGAATRPAMTGRILLNVPDEHIPTSPPKPSTTALSVSPLTTQEVQALLDGSPEPTASDTKGKGRATNGSTDSMELTRPPKSQHPFGDLPHQVIGVAGSSELTQQVQTTLQQGSGNAWQFTLYGSTPHDAVMRQFQPQVIASFLDQSISDSGMRMVELFGAGPYVNRMGRLTHRVSLQNALVQSKPVSVETEQTLGAETQVNHATTSVTVAKLNLGFAYARSHDGRPSPVGTYGLVINGTWSKGRTATVTNTVAVDNDRDDESPKYLVSADIKHEVGFSTRANGLAGPLRVLLPALQSHFAGFQLSLPGGWLGHVPEKTAHRLSLVGATLPPAPRYQEDSWSPAPWLKDTPFGSFPVNTLDSTKAAQDFAKLLKSKGVDDAGRDHILDMVTPRTLLALRQQMSATGGGVTAVTRTAWRSLGEVHIGSQRATVRIELIQTKTEFDGIDHSVTFQETLGMTETVDVAISKARSRTAGFSITEALRTGNPKVPNAGPALSESISATQQRAATTSTARLKNYTFYPNEPHADFLVQYELRMVLVDSDGTELSSGNSSVGTLREQLPLSLAVPDTDDTPVENHASASTSQQISEIQEIQEVQETRPRRNTVISPAQHVSPPPAVTVRRPGQLTDAEITAWRQQGVPQAFTMPANGFMPRRITQADTALNAAQLAMAKAYNAKLPHLPRSATNTRLTGDTLTQAVAAARKSGPAPQGGASGQALSDGLSSTQTAAFFANTATDSGYLAAALHDDALVMDTEGSYRLFSRPRLGEAVLLSVAAEATMESPERQTTSADTTITDSGAQSTTINATIGTAAPSVGSIAPSPAGSGGNTGEAEALKATSADGTQKNIKPKTGRAILFSIPTDWLGEATIARGKVAGMFGPGSTSQAVEYQTHVLTWVREDVARELGLIDDTTFPTGVADAWTAVAAASKAWVDADKAYWKLRRSLTESVGTNAPDPSQLDELETKRTSAHDAMREFRRVRTAADRLTRWHHQSPRPVGPPPPPVTFTAPAKAKPVVPKYTGTAFTPATGTDTAAGPKTIVSPSGDTYTLRDVPEDGDAFFHALTAGLRHTGTPLPGPTGDPADTDTPLTTLLDRMTETLTDDSGDLLDFTTPDLLDTFTPQELADGGPTYAEGSPEAREFADAARTLPLYGELRNNERRALALTQLQRAGNSPNDTGWDHGAADLLPALAARTFDVTVTVVRDDGTFQEFAPPSTTASTDHVVLYLKDRHYQVALAPRPQEEVQVQVQNQNQNQNQDQDREAERRAEREAMRQREAEREAERRAEREARRQREAERQAEREAMRQREAERRAEQEAERKREAERQAEQEARLKREAERRAEQEAERKRAQKEKQEREEAREQARKQKEEQEKKEKRRRKQEREREKEQNQEHAQKQARKKQREEARKQKQKQSRNRAREQRWQEEQEQAWTQEQEQEQEQEENQTQEAEAQRTHDQDQDQGQVTILEEDDRSDRDEPESNSSTRDSQHSETERKRAQKQQKQQREQEREEAREQKEKQEKEEKQRRKQEREREKEQNQEHAQKQARKKQREEARKQKQKQSRNRAREQRWQEEQEQAWTQEQEQEQEQEENQTQEQPEVPDGPDGSDEPNVPGQPMAPAPAPPAGHNNPPVPLPTSPEFLGWVLDTHGVRNFRVHSAQLSQVTGIDGAMAELALLGRSATLGELGLTDDQILRVLARNQYASQDAVTYLRRNERYAAILRHED